AIALRVSPACTTYEPSEAGAALVADEQPTSSESPSTSQLSELAVEADVVPVVVLVETAPVWGGIASVEPAISWVSGEMPLAAASWSSVSPSVAATEVSVSPGETTCRKLAEAAVGAASPN